MTDIRVALQSLGIMLTGALVRDARAQIAAATS